MALNRDVERIVADDQASDIAARVEAFVRDTVAFRVSFGFGFQDARRLSRLTP
jgi:hypothetical protein